MWVGSQCIRDLIQEGILTIVIPFLEGHRRRATVLFVFFLLLSGLNLVLTLVGSLIKILVQEEALKHRGEF